MNVDFTQKHDIEKLLSEGKTIQLHPQGYSMYPMFTPDKDEAIIIPIHNASTLKRGDVVLYRRDGGILVLHRIYRVKHDGIYLVGDNQTEVEGPLRSDQMKGVLVAFIRNGREISASNLLYILVSRLWLFMRPVRHFITIPVAHIKRLFRHNQQ